MASGLGLCQALLLLITISDFLSNGVAEGRNISKEEYLQMQAYLKFINKPAVKSIQTEHGDIFDCVDIHKQPALDHPLLRNHTIQIRPSSYPNEIENDASSSKIINIGLKNGGCPSGTVPIRRTRMRDILRTKSLSYFGKKAVYNNNHHYAVIGTKGAFYGSKASLNPWNPTLRNTRQFSLSQFWISGGPTDQLNSVEAGWTVYPQVFGDSRPRLFTYWTADGYSQTGCYNTLCPGFVQVSQEIPAGIVLQSSTYGGSQYEISLSAFKDTGTGNWFLRAGDKVVGYWPNSLFNYLNTKAENAQWGGEVFAPSSCSGDCRTPQMGSGHFPEEGFNKACYIRNMKVMLNSDGALTDPTATYSIIDEPSCYRVLQNPASGSTQLGFHILLGGPGGCGS